MSFQISTESRSSSSADCDAFASLISDLLFFLIRGRQLHRNRTAIYNMLASSVNLFLGLISVAIFKSDIMYKDCYGYQSRSRDCIAGNEGKGWKN